MATNEIPIGRRLTCTVQEARRVSGLSERTIHERIATGTLKSTKEGEPGRRKRRLVIVASLLAMLGVDRDGNPVEPGRKRGKTDASAAVAA